MQQDQEDCMSQLTMAVFDIPDIPGAGLWFFLSVGAIAMFGIFLPVTTWIESRRKERDAFYKAETVRRLTEAPSEGAKAAVELIREQDRLERAKRYEGMKVGGLINLGIGLALIVFLHMLIPYQAVYMCGLIPAAIGLALLLYVFLLAKKPE
jgi:hypothetical protein